MEEIETIKNELNEIKTARDNIKTALENEGETVTNDIRTYANTIPNVNKVKTVNSVEADENKNIQLDASKINLDDTAETKQTIKETIDNISTKALVKDTYAANVFIAKGTKEPYDCIGMEIWEKTLDGKIQMRNHNVSRICSPSGSIKIQGLHGGVTDISISVESENVTFDPQESGITSTKIAPAIRELKGKIDAISVPDYSIIETTVTEGYSKTYSLTKDGVEVGVKINIPKDLVVNKGSVKVVATEGTPYEGAIVGDKYLDIELNDPTKDHIYIPVKELVDVYTAGDGIEISADNVIKSKNSNLINGSRTGSLRSINSAEESSDYTIGPNAFAEGRNTKASGSMSHAEGNRTVASGSYSHSEGVATIASAQASHAEGTETIASGNDSHVQGRYNIEDTINKYAHIVGNGNYDGTNTTRSNAHTIDWSGNGWFQGNVKVGGTGQDDTNAKQLATEEYVNNELEPVKTDVNLIQDTVGGIFYWDGQSSSENPNNIQLWQNILDKHLEQSVLIYSGKKNIFESVCVLPKNKVNLSVDGNKTIDLGNINTIQSYQTSNTALLKREFRIVLIISGGKVTSINNGTTIGSTLGYYLDTDKDYNTPYMPKYAGSPATKKYVDDNKYLTKTITKRITENQDAGYTCTFNYVCDNLMVFLNGEKLIGREEESQTINEYSYIPNYNSNDKCTSITFTDDFTIVTGDIIELILINPIEIPS